MVIQILDVYLSFLQDCNFAIQLPSTITAQLTLHTECERSCVHPYYHTGVVQTIVGGSQGVGTCICLFKWLEGDTGVAKSYSRVVAGR